MSKRKADHLGLGGYGSSEEEEEEEQSQGQQEEEEENTGTVHILGGYGEDEDAEANGNRDEPGEAGPGRSPSIQRGREPSVPLDSNRASEAVSAEASNDGRAAQPSEDAQEQEAAMVPAADPNDPFSLLPPELRQPPEGECKPGVEARIFNLARKSRECNIYLNDQLRNKKAYRNPDFLQRMVEHFGVKEVGTAFAQERFDPSALPAEDRIDSLIRQLDREQERRRQQREAQARQGAPGPPIQFERGSGPGATLHPSTSTSSLNVAQLRQQAQLNAAALASSMVMAGAAGDKKRSKWDTGR